MEITEKATLKFRLKWGTESVWGLNANAKMTSEIEQSIKTINSTLNFSDIKNLNNNNNINMNNNINSSKNELKVLQNGIENNYGENDKMTIVYRFMYNTSTRQQTESPTHYICPWCALKCSCLYNLLKHLNYTHPRFVFTYFPLNNEGARIDVTINDLYDGSYSGSPHDLLHNIGFVSRNGPVRRTSVTNILVCRPRRHKGSLNEFLELDENEFETQRSHITGHNR